MLSKYRGAALAAVVALGAAVLSGCTQSIAGTAVLPSTVADMPVPTLEQLCRAVPADQLAPLVGDGGIPRVAPLTGSPNPMLVCNVEVRSEDGTSSLQGYVSVSRPSQMLNSVADGLAQWRKTGDDTSLGGQESASGTPASQIPEVAELEVLGHRAGFLLFNHPDTPEKSRQLRIDVADDLVLEVFLGIDDGVTGDLGDPAPLVGVAATVMRAMQATTVGGDLLDATDVLETGASRLCAAVPLDQLTALVQRGEFVVASPMPLPAGKWRSSDPGVTCELLAHSAGSESSPLGEVALLGPTIPSRRSVADFVAARTRTEGPARSNNEAPIRTFTELQVDGYPALFVVLTDTNHPGNPYRFMQVDLPGGGTLQMRLLITSEELGDMADPAPIAAVASSILAVYRG